MDPDENLAAQRSLAERVVNAEDPDPDDAHRLAELALALDGWIKAGGFLPAAWRR